MKDDETEHKRPTWDEVMAHGRTVRVPYTKETLIESWKLAMEMDVSTIPDDVDLPNEEWRQEKAEAKAAARKEREARESDSGVR